MQDSAEAILADVPVRSEVYLGGACKKRSIGGNVL